MTTIIPQDMTADRSLHKHVLGYILANVPVEAKILDLGSGQGALVYKLKESNYRNITPVDLTRDYWKLDGVELLIMDLNKDFSELGTGTYDVICAIEIIEHVESPYQFLRNCHRLLKQDGLLILTTPNVESFASRMIFLWNGRLRFFSEGEINNHHVTPIFGWYLDQAFKRIGYKEEKTIFTKDKMEISNSLKAKVAGWLLGPLRYRLKGDVKGENRIHIVKKGVYREPTSK
jgi:SAM-dependent methyltransferase